MEKVRKIVCFGGKKGCEKKSRTAEPWFVLGGGGREGLGRWCLLGIIEIWDLVWWFNIFGVILLYWNWEILILHINTERNVSQDHA
jgi:hypothetical protein